MHLKMRLNIERSESWHHDLPGNAGVLLRLRSGRFHRAVGGDPVTRAALSGQMPSARGMMLWSCGQL